MKNDVAAHRLPLRKLMISYLIVIMGMSIIFSSVFYITSAHELDRRPVGDIKSSSLQDPDHELDEWLGRRSDNGKDNLSMHLIILNVSALIVGSVLSYILARWTLRPIEQVLQQQEQFIANASHELRTPITSALLNNEVALRNKNLTIVSARSALQDNVRDMQELKQLSDDLLVDSSHNTRKTDISKFDVSEISAIAILKLSTLAHRKNTTIMDETTALIIKSDADKLQRILLILIENAVKYSPSGSMIRVISRQSRFVKEISIIDNGIGIQESDLKNIFNRFYRADSSRTEVVGYGLGLSIAKELIDDIGAKIKVRSSIDEGTTFTISFSNR